jgi:hypothetical protein
MLNQWPNLALPGKSPDLLVVVAFVTEKYVDILWVALDQRWSDLTIVFPRRRHVEIEDCVHPRIDQERHFEPLNREFSSFRVVFRSVTAVKS